LKDTRGKANFKKSVREALSRDHLEISTGKKLSTKARLYMLAYHLIDGCADENGTSHHMIEKIVKTFKTHRNVATSDTSFVACVIKNQCSNKAITREQFLGIAFVFFFLRLLMLSFLRVF
jgi:hypothetical protein